MKLVIFGLTISSAWGNGHATLWRGLCAGLADLGHFVAFFERDVDYYATSRDLTELERGELVLYQDPGELRQLAARHLQDADAALVTSFCPDGILATELVLSSRVPIRAFYDLDTPVTLSQLKTGRPVAYLGPRGLQDFDLVLSYTGGAALTELQRQLGARRVAPLYGSVDPTVHRPVPSKDKYRCDLSYLGTYAEDRQATLERLLLEPARRLPERRFLIGGAQYPVDFPWQENVWFVRHRDPAEHAAVYCSSRLTLNVTRQAMAEMGYCPSGRLFEAAACGVPLISDVWQGLEEFFVPGEEILLARSPEDAIAAIEQSDRRLQRLGQAAQARTLEQYTAAKRAEQLEQLLSDALAHDSQAAESFKPARSLP